MDWILALLRVIPGLSKIFSWLGKRMRYASAEKRRKQKHDRIDDSIDAALDGVRDTETKQR
jgi:hypothetical protein